MHRYTADIHWTRQGSTFTDNRYSRVHEWRFDGGVVLPASSSPLSVRVPFSDPAAVDPEEAFVAALSSCHMLTCLYLAARAGWVVDRYDDAAVGLMEKLPNGREAVTRVTLHPALVFTGPKSPTDEQVVALHHEAHEECYLANSVRTQIDVQGSWSWQAA